MTTRHLACCLLRVARLRGVWSKAATRRTSSARETSRRPSHRHSRRSKPGLSTLEKLLLETLARAGGDGLSVPEAG
jgi:hypothetical protein